MSVEVVEIFAKQTEGVGKEVLERKWKNGIRDLGDFFDLWMLETKERLGIWICYNALINIMSDGWMKNAIEFISIVSKSVDGSKSRFSSHRIEAPVIS